MDSADLYLFKPVSNVPAPKIRYKTLLVFVGFSPHLGRLLWHLNPLNLTHLHTHTHRHFVPRRLLPNFSSRTREQKPGPNCQLIDVTAEPQNPPNRNLTTPSDQANHLLWSELSQRLNVTTHFLAADSEHIVIQGPTYSALVQLQHGSSKETPSIMHLAFVVAVTASNETTAFLSVAASGMTLHRVNRPPGADLRDNCFFFFFFFYSKLRYFPPCGNGNACFKVWVTAL